MLGLGTNIIKSGAGAKTIVTDNLVLKHNYSAGAVQPLSDGAASFNGTSDYITMGDACDLGAADFSITLWAYLPTTASQNFVSKFTDGNNRWFLQTNSSSDIFFQGKVGGSAILSQDYSGDAVPQNEWFHVTVTCDRSDGTNGLLTYLNGVPGTATNGDIGGALTTLNNAADLEFGIQDTAEMGGYMCNVGIWDAVLSQAEVKSIMNKNYAGLSDSEKTSLVSWWNLDSTTTEVATAVYDNHGGETFGSEVLNQPILTGTNWSNANGTVSDGVGTVTIPADGAYSYFLQGSMAGSYTEGAIYKATVTVQGTVGKSIRVRSNTANNGGLTTVNGTFTLTGNLQEEEFYFISNGSDQEFAIERSTASAFSFDIHSASLKKLNGNTGTLS